MVGEIIEKLLQEAVTQLLELNDPVMKTFCEFCTNESIDNKEKREILGNIAAHLFTADEEFREEELHALLNEFMKWIKEQRKAFLFKVSLNEKNIDSMRLFRLPANYTVAQLAYAVMAAFNAEGCHEYCVQYNRREFVMDFSDSVIEAEELAGSFTLGELNLQKGQRLRMEYDTKEQWSFLITVAAVEMIDEDFNTPELLDWEGFNLWENGKKYLIHYKEDPNESIYDYCGDDISIQRYMEENEIDKVSLEQVDEFEDNIHLFSVKYEDECFKDDEVIWPEEFNLTRFS